MIDPCWLPASLMQVSSTLLGIYVVIYVLVVQYSLTDSKLRGKKILDTMLVVITFFSLLTLFLTGIWLDIVSAKVFDWSYFEGIELDNLKELAIISFICEIVAILVYTGYMIKLLEKKELAEASFRVLLSGLILCVFVNMLFTEGWAVLEMTNYNMYVPFIIGSALIAIIFVIAYIDSNLHFKDIRCFCKNLEKPNEKELLCRRCKGFYLGLFIFLLSYVSSPLFIPDIRQIELPTTYIILLSGIIVVLNVIQGVLRRFDYPYLFNWDNVPGSDSERLLRYIRDVLKIDWTGNAEIRKSEDNKSIHIFKGDNSAEMSIEDKTEKVAIKIKEGITYDLGYKKENGKRIIYKYSKLNFFMSDMSAFILGLLFGLFTSICGLLFGTSTAVYPL